MKNKECKITCDGKEIANLDCSKGGLSVKYTEDGKKFMKDNCNCDLENCC